MVSWHIENELPKMPTIANTIFFLKIQIPHIKPWFLNLHIHSDINASFNGLLVSVYSHLFFFYSCFFLFVLFLLQSLA